MSISAVALGFGQSDPSKARQNLPSGSTFGDILSGLTGASDPTAADSKADPVKTFTDLVKGTPQEKMFKLFLARHHLTEDQFKQLSSDDQKKLTDEFKTETKKKTAGTVDTGKALDVSA